MFSAGNITSVHNPKIKYAMSLMKKKERDVEKLFLIEGFRELSRACQAGVQVEHCFFCPEFFLGNQELPLLEELRSQGAALYACTEG
ncbi:MAG: RNA methyltransferase, partial [Chlamydiae bacterium]|nr:RNA methyltransferase [Chlamydiota bacterium]